MKRRKLKSFEAKYLAKRLGTTARLVGIVFADIDPDIPRKRNNRVRGRPLPGAVR